MKSRLHDLSSMLNKSNKDLMQLFIELEEQNAALAFAVQKLMKKKINLSIKVDAEKVDIGIKMKLDRENNMIHFERINPTEEENEKVH